MKLYFPASFGYTIDRSGVLMKIRSLNPSDLLLLETARSVITSRFDSDRFRHTVAASARMASGRVVSAVNVFASCGSGPCAEAVLLGMAATEDERDARVIVAVGGA